MHSIGNSKNPQKSLINSIALIGVLGATFVLVVLILFFGWPKESNRFLFVGTIILFLTAMVANKFNRTLLAKYLLSYIPVIFTLAISIVNKKIGPIYINDYYVSRVAILAVSIIPILVFRFNEYRHLALAMLPSLISLIFFDVIHDSLGVGIFQTGYEDDTYFLTNYIMTMCYLAMNGFIYSIKRKNDIYFAQLKEFSQNLQNKVKARTSELTKLNQELAEQNVKLEQFTFMTAHNLKAPIAQIKGLLNLFGYEKSIPKSAKTLLTKIESSSTNLEEVISDLNKILNIKNDSHIFEKVNTSELIDHVILSLTNDVKKKKIIINRRYNAIIEFTTIKAFIYSIFFNLINNAVKYADLDKETREINIGLDIRDEKLHFYIKDNGIGFDMGMAGEKVFQLYQRFNTHIQGKGLGLYLVKTQVDMLNGEITIKSEIDKGTEIKIFIPKLDT